MNIIAIKPLIYYVLYSMSIIAIKSSISVVVPIYF